MARKPHVWITGAGSGIGAALARCLGPDFNISLSGRRTGLLEDVMKEIGHDRSLVVPCDVSLDDSVRQAHEHTLRHFGPVDVLVNGAGTATFDTALATPVDVTLKQINVNLLGAVRCIQSVLPDMVNRGHGMIMTINSVAALTVFENCTSYAASKAGLLAYTRGLRKEIRASGVKVVDLFVGATATSIWSDGMLNEHRSRMMQPDDVAKVMKDVILLRDNSAMMVEELTLRPQLGDL